MRLGEDYSLCFQQVDKLPRRTEGRKDLLQNDVKIIYLFIEEDEILFNYWLKYALYVQYL